jgi:O-antigen/teichoic acid export membrane protein
MVSMIVLARVLTPADFAAAGIAATAAGTISVVSGTGFSQAAVASESLDEEQIDTLLWFTLALNAGVAVAVCAASPLLARYYAKPDLWLPICGCSLGLLTGVPGGVVEVKLLRAMQFDRLAFLASLGALVAAFLAVSLALSGVGMWALILPAPLAGVMTALIGCRLAGIRPGFRYRWGSIRSFTKTGFSLQSSRLVQFLADNVDYMVLGRVFSKPVFGQYYFAFERSRWLGNILEPPMTAPIYPALVLARVRPDDFKRLVLRTTTLTWSVLAMVQLPLLVAAPIVIPFVFGQQWTPAVVAFQWFAVATLVKAASGPSVLALLAQNRAIFFFYYNLLRLIPTACVVLFVAGQGRSLNSVATGVALVTAASLCGLAVATHRAIGIRFSEMGRAYGPILLGFGGAAAAWWACRATGLLVGYVLREGFESIVVTGVFGGIVICSSSDLRGYLRRTALATAVRLCISTPTAE